VALERVPTALPDEEPAAAAAAPIAGGTAVTPVGVKH